MTAEHPALANQPESLVRFVERTDEKLTILTAAAIDAQRVSIIAGARAARLRDEAEADRDELDRVRSEQATRDAEAARNAARTADDAARRVFQRYIRAAAELAAQDDPTA